MDRYAPSSLLADEPQAPTLEILLQGKLVFSVDELDEARILGKTRFYEEVKAGRLKARKNGGRTQVLTPDLIAYLRALPIIPPDVAAQRPATSIPSTPGGAEKRSTLRRPGPRRGRRAPMENVDQRTIPTTDLGDEAA